MGCPSCGRGFHDECENGCANCHPEVIHSITRVGSGAGRGQPLKDPDKVTDPYSTGRKRAAIQYPLFKTNPCEWRGKKNCGGGNAIVGCISGLQQDRHHGPVKNPLRNEPGNVHRICKNCHARWHATNDPDYDELKWDNTIHAPELATEVELLANEMQWRVKSG
jgi:hypothetical protein